MSERDAVDAVETPVTVDNIASDLRDLGVSAGDTLLVHASLGSLGWVAGGAQTVVEALQRAVTTNGTLVVPTVTGQSDDPAVWSNPPVPDEWADGMPERLPAFRPAPTPSRDMGAVPECLRTYPGAVRSRHPEYSFAAWGAEADAVVTEHSFAAALGDRSPLAEAYDRDGSVILLLAVGHAVNSSLHLAESPRNPEPPRASATGRPANHGRVRGHRDQQRGLRGPGRRVRTDRRWGRGACRHECATLLEQPALVDFAVEWLSKHR